MVDKITLQLMQNQGLSERFKITMEDYWAVDTLKVGGKLLEGIRAQPTPWIDRGQGGPENKSKIKFHQV